MRDFQKTIPAIVLAILMLVQLLLVTSVVGIIKDLDYIGGSRPGMSELEGVSSTIKWLWATLFLGYAFQLLVFLKVYKGIGEQDNKKVEEEVEYLTNEGITKYKKM